MDNKIILGLIKKDLEEIKILVEALEQSTSDEQILISITTSKAKILLDEITLLKVTNTDEPAVKVTDSENKEQCNEGTERQEPNEDPAGTADNLTVNAADEIEADIEIKEEIVIPQAIEIEKVITTEKVNDEIIAEQQLTTIENIENEEALVEEPIIEEKKSLIVEESVPEKIKSDEPQIKESKILGENFTKEPSLNERFAAVNGIKTKNTGKPVTSIKGAIGINDKFMYSRELFDNNTEKLNSTIETLDNASNLIEAVEYLEQNFKWQKNDVSLKFMELVKRRFES